MPSCKCGKQVCGCRIVAGSGVSIAGSGTATDPWVISSEAGGGLSDWLPGDIKDTMRTTTDAGWLLCNGQAVSRTTYASLYAALGTRYGAGDGSSTFNLPNFTGRFRMGFGTGYAQDSTGGAETTTLGVQHLPVHTHGMNHTHSIDHNHVAFDTTDGGTHTHAADLRVRTANLPNHRHSVPAGSGAGDTGLAGSTNQGDTLARAADQGSLSGSPLDWSGPDAGAHHHTINVPPYTGTSGASSRSDTGPVGAGQSFSNLPPYRAVRVVIKT